MHPLGARLFKDDPYAGLNPDAWPSDIHGWGDHGEHFSRLAKDAKLIIEIGAWKGRGTLTLARECPQAVILSVDTFLGSEEMWQSMDDPSRYDALRITNGYPQLQREFLANMIRAGLQERVIPIPLPSDIALSIIRSWGIQPDLIYIDASHDYASVKRDIINSIALEPKVLCGDDYQPGWLGVVQAVDEMLPTANKNGVFWWL